MATTATEMLEKPAAPSAEKALEGPGLKMFIYFSALQGRPVLGADRRRIGKLADLKVKLGELARVYTDAYSDRWFEGHVSKIAPTLDAASHTAEVEILIPNPQLQLRPGMFVHVELVVDKHADVPVVPKTVVSKRMGKDMIFVFNPADGLVEMRESRLGFYDLKSYEILSGVKAGELVVTEDQAILQDGVKASIAGKIGDKAAPKQEPGKESPEKAEGK